MAYSWFAPLTIDLIFKVLNVTIFHPFVAWIIPLCFRAEHMHYGARPLQVTIAWATTVTLVWIFNRLSHKLAFGVHREVDLSEEVIVITGGASGLGLLIAEVYGMRGATVAVLDVVELESTDLRGISFYKCDVRDKAAIARVAAQVESELGTPSILINNAAIVVGKKLLDMDLDEVDDSMAVNLLSHFYTIKTFLPGMLRNECGGTIVTMSSVLGHLGAAQLTDYSAAKAGVTAMHKSLQAELSQYPEIKTILVTPGQLNTALFYGVKSPHTFIGPVVEPVDVAKEVIAAIDLGISDHIALPLYARWIDLYNILPAGLQRIVRRWSGIDEGMKTFVGRRTSKLDRVASDGIDRVPTVGATAGEDDDEQDSDLG